MKASVTNRRLVHSPVGQMRHIHLQRRVLQ